MLNSSLINDFTKGFKIYLHERGQFWPALEMERIGQTKSISIPLRTEVKGTFTMVKKTNLDKQSVPCVKDPNYSFTHCMKQYVATTAGCHLDWDDKGGGLTGDDHALGTCMSPDQVQQYSSVLSSISKLSWTQLVNISGCNGKCSYKQYTFEKVCVQYITYSCPSLLKSLYKSFF